MASKLSKQGNIKRLPIPQAVISEQPPSKKVDIDVENSRRRDTISSSERPTMLKNEERLRVSNLARLRAMKERRNEAALEAEKGKDSKKANNIVPNPETETSSNYIRPEKRNSSFQVESHVEVIDLTHDSLTTESELPKATKYAKRQHYSSKERFPTATGASEKKKTTGGVESDRFCLDNLDIDKLVNFVDGFESSDTSTLERDNRSNQRSPGRLGSCENHKKETGNPGLKRSVLGKAARALARSNVIQDAGSSVKS
jgi:hypothetical protein